MPFDPPPPQVAYRHRDARDGFEVAFLERGEEATRIEGHTAAVEDGVAWAVEYAIELDPAWVSRRARVVTHSAAGRDQTVLELDEDGRWNVDGSPAPELDGCLDVDLEASSLTNAFPVRRLALGVGEASEAPAAYVRVAGGAVERLEQRYARIADEGDRRRFDYAAPRFDFACRLVYDGDGFVSDYPGIAVRSR